MGYLDNSTVTVDAILTNKGREILAGGGQLKITKFALSDDEIDYDLWNPAHTLGTNYYGAVIENMPVLEALPDETQMLRYKLITLPKDATGIPVITVSPQAITFTALTQEITVSPSAPQNYASANSTLGYTAILSDDTVADIRVAPGSEVTSTGTSMTVLSDQVGGITTAGKSISVIGLRFIVTPKNQVGLTQKRALLTIIGNETGGFKTVSITVDPTNFGTVSIVPRAGLTGTSVSDTTTSFGE